MSPPPTGRPDTVSPIIMSELESSHTGCGNFHRLGDCTTSGPHRSPEEIFDETGRYA